jgi:predicted NAD/FAD-binding protein
MLAAVTRFHRLARAELARVEGSGYTLGEFLATARFSLYFTAHFMVPLVAAVWSCPPEVALVYPIGYLLAFLDHHGMLTVFGSPTWRTVNGGSARYVEAVTARLHAVRCGVPVRSVTRTKSGVTIRDDADRVEQFDATVLATHPGQALAMRDQPTRAEVEVLSALRYSINHTVPHTDTSVLPIRPGARASWCSCASRAPSHQKSRRLQCAAREVAAATTRPNLSPASLSVKTGVSV